MVRRFQGYLSDRDIDAHRTELFPNESDEITTEGASVDLRLGSEYHLSSQRESRRLSADNPHLVIPSGDFAVLMTKETVQVPKDVIGFITMKLGYKAKGLINVSGQRDAGNACERRHSSDSIPDEHVWIPPPRGIAQQRLMERRTCLIVSPPHPLRSWSLQHSRGGSVEGSNPFSRSNFATPWRRSAESPG